MHVHVHAHAHAQHTHTHTFTLSLHRTIDVRTANLTNAHAPQMELERVLVMKRVIMSMNGDSVEDWVLKHRPPHKRKHQAPAGGRLRIAISMRLAERKQKGLMVFCLSTAQVLLHAQRCPRASQAQMFSVAVCCGCKWITGNPNTSTIQYQNVGF